MMIKQVIAEEFNFIIIIESKEISINSLVHTLHTMCLPIFTNTLTCFSLLQLLQIMSRIHVTHFHKKHVYSTKNIIVRYIY